MTRSVNASAGSSEGTNGGIWSPGYAAGGTRISGDHGLHLTTVVYGRGIRSSRHNLGAWNRQLILDHSGTKSMSEESVTEDTAQRRRLGELREPHLLAGGHHVGFDHVAPDDPYVSSWASALEHRSSAAFERSVEAIDPVAIWARTAYVAGWDFHKTDVNGTQLPPSLKEAQGGSQYVDSAAVLTRVRGRRRSGHGLALRGSEAQLDVRRALLQDEPTRKEAFRCLAASRYHEELQRAQA